MEQTSVDDYVARQEKYLKELDETYRKFLERNSRIKPLVPIPEAVLHGLHAYVVSGRGTGHFLLRLLENDLFGVFHHADNNSVAALGTLIGYIYNELPVTCYGSPEEVAAWRKGNGLLGKPDGWWQGA